MKLRGTFGAFPFAAIVGIAVLSGAGHADACGGLFCSSASQPVNQAAERILFADNQDGTVTAVIQILYQGDAPKFSWLLPISTVPSGDTLAVSSDIAFQRLQTATNPQYVLTTQVEGTCDPPPISLGYGGASAASFGGNSGAGGPSVTVKASGTVGAFEWKAIALDPALQDPADAAVTWLKDNGYSVDDGARGLLRPYLAEGLYLLALRLTNGASAGSIRPIMLTYDAKQPMIPIKLTAVAANQDMGVMTWLLGNSRGVPQNYLSLELNETKINWFNANSNYNAVVTQAADDASGQGFVTEYAQKSAALSGVVWGYSDDAGWSGYRGSTFTSFDEAFQAAYQRWGSWDGFWESWRPNMKLPDGTSQDQYEACPYCSQGTVSYADGKSFDDVVTALEAQVIEPMRATQKLLDQHAYVTRLYTTMSAAEMTVDPLFTFNPSLSDVSNVHTQTRIIECAPGYQTFSAPWRVEFPVGAVHGVGSSWPTDASVPANNRIVRTSAAGPGVVVEDNSALISQQLAAYDAGQTGGATAGGAAAAGAPAGGGNVSMAGQVAMPSGGRSVGGSGPGGSPAVSTEQPKRSHGCSYGSATSPSGGWLTLALVGLLGMRRRRRCPGTASGNSCCQ